MLYDLADDPGETRNVGTAHADIRKQMRNEMLAWMKQTKDPLLATYRKSISAKQ